jgi:uncharacterized paraquat-inducible protein A
MYMTKRFQCHDCGHAFERMVLESVVTAVCPKCRPFVSFLEGIGLTPEQALLLTLFGVAVSYIAAKT